MVSITLADQIVQTFLDRAEGDLLPMPCRHWQTTNLTTAQIEFIRDCAFFVELAIVDDTLKSFLHDVFLRFFMNWKLSSNPFHVSTGKMNEKMRTITSALAKAHQTRREVVPGVSWRAMVATNNDDDWRKIIQEARVEYNKIPRKFVITYAPCTCSPPPQVIEIEDSDNSDANSSHEGSDTDDSRSTLSDSGDTASDEDSDGGGRATPTPSGTPRQANQSNGESTVEESGDVSDSSYYIPYPVAVLRRLIASSKSAGTRT